MSRNQAENLFDPLPVREIRAIRRKLWKRAGGTWEGYSKLIHELAARPVGTPRKARKPARKAA